jgi:hypothetical protein
VDEVDSLADLRHLLWLLVLMWQAGPRGLRGHLRRTSLLGWIWPVSGLLSMAKWEARWHMLRVHRRLSHVCMVVWVVRLWRLIVNLVDWSMGNVSLVLGVMLLLLEPLLVLRGSVAPGLEDREERTALVGLRCLVSLEALGRRLNLEKALKLLCGRFESMGCRAGHVLLHHWLRLSIGVILGNTLVHREMWL